MMSLIARSNERAPSALSSTASESPVKTRHESQSLLISQAEKYDRTGRPVVCPQGGAYRPVVNGHSSRYSERNVDKTWSSQEWKSDELMDDRTGRPVVCSQRASQTRFSREHKNVIFEEEENHDRTGRPVVCPQGGALGSRSFLQRVNDQMRKRQQMFDICEKLTTEQSDEIYGVKTINLENSSWKYLSSVGDEQVISLQRTKVYVFSDSVLCVGKMNENPQSNTAWEERLAWFKSSPEYRTLDRIDGEPNEFEWNIFPRFNTLQLSHKVQELLLRLKHQRILQDISWGSRDNKKECESNAQLVSLFAKRFGAGQWSFLGPGSEKKVVFYQ